MLHLTSVNALCVISKSKEKEAAVARSARAGVCLSGNAVNPSLMVWTHPPSLRPCRAEGQDEGD